MNIKPKTLVFSAGLFLFFPVMVSAANLGQQYDQLYSPIPTNEIFCPTAVCDLTGMLLLIMRDILQLIPIASVLFIVIGGFKMVMSQGNEEKLLEAKRTVYWAVAGLAIALLSFSIIAMMKSVLGVVL